MIENKFILGDCMDPDAGLPSYPDGYFDLAIVDPPYGIGEGQKRVNSRVTKKVNPKWKNRRAPQYGGKEWDSNPPNKSYFKELRRVSKNQIIWGANHFGNMPPSSGWVVWYKKRVDEVNDFSDAELAYTSFNKGVRLAHYSWIGFGAVNKGEKRIHPTHKPIELYKWLLHNYAKPGDLILDTHVGSASSLIACESMDFNYVGYEIDPEYYAAAKNRMSKGIQKVLI